MRRVYCTLLILFSLTMPICAQMSVEEIKENPEYLTGEGWGESNKAANNAALQDLISKISVSVESQFENIEEEVTDGTSVDSHSACKSVVNTYSQATIQNTECIYISHEPDAHVFRYVKRSDVDKIFDSRRQKVFDMAASAARAKDKFKIDDALRYYYWAYCLLQSIPNANAVVDEQGHVLTHWIPEQINEIFSQIAAYKVSEADNVAEIRVLFNGEPVTSMDYTYFDGMDWSNLYGAKDGRGFVELRPGMTTDNLRIKCEYEYSGEAHIDKEISTVVNVMKGKVFRDAYIMLSDAPAPAPKKEEPQAEPEAAPEALAVAQTEAQSTESADVVAKVEALPKNDITELSAEEAAPYRKSIEAVIAAIRSGNYNSVDTLFSPDGKDMYRRLISYGNARIMSEPQLSFYMVGAQKDVTCRSVAMSFSFRNNNRKFVEDVTFTFNADKKIDCLAFGLDKNSTDDILKHDMWSEYARTVLAEFLENYKTAYALKRLDYIRSIFDDNAVIITGKVTTRMTGTDNANVSLMNNKYVQFTRQNKEQYLRNLERCFDSNEYINIRFANNDIVKAGVGGEVYGIQIKQDYYSTNYGDTGYLFLLVDINNPKEPSIKVRTWQPEPDPMDGIIGIEDF